MSEPSIHRGPLPKQLGPARLDPDLLRAGKALVENDLPTAESILRPYLKRRPFDVKAIRMMAELAARVGRLVDAENLLRRAIELAPGFTAARSNLATVLYKQNRPLDAIAELDEMARRDEAAERRHAGLKAAAMSRIGRLDEARDLYRLVLDKNPDEPKLWMSYGHILKSIGARAEAVDAYRQSLAIEPTLGETWWSLANLKTAKFSPKDVAAMTSALQKPGLDENDRFHLHFALGKALEDAGEVEASFDHYANGNRLRRAQLRYDAKTTARQVGRSIETFTSEFFAAREGSGSPSPEPIFIIGMPRAGSTLIEQILSSHSSVEGTAELPDIPQLASRIAGSRDRNASYVEQAPALSPADLRALGEEYLERASVQRFTDKPFFIDKLPNNWQYLGLIRLILPNARIIDARRHPLACGFSNFKQHYANGQIWSYDLAEIGSFYANYVRMMRHFDEVTPGAIHRVIHEELVDDPEYVVRRLLDYLGLPFEESCLSFYENPRAVRTASSEQVRRPISREGLEQWKAFDPWLGPLKTGLGPVLQDWHR